MPIPSPAVTGAKPAHPYFHGLDIIRFFAAAAVALYHLDGAYQHIALTFWWGWVGVEMFFLLSGAVIANSAEGVGTRAFVVSRILRLYPAALACAVINLALLLLRKPIEAIDFLKLFASITLIPKGGFLFIPGTVLPNQGFLAGAYWTLPVEIAFYALVAVAIRLGFSQRLDRLAIGLGAVSSLFILVLSLDVLGLFHAPLLDFKHGLLNLTLLRHGVLFAAGMLLARHARHGLAAGQRIALIAFVAMGVVETAVSAAGPEHAPASIAGDWRAWALPSGMFLATAALVTLAMSGSARLEAWLEPFHYPLRVMGLLTYPLYLVHQNVGFTLAVHVGSDLGAPAFIAAGLVISTALAAIVALMVEPPLRQCLRSWLSSGARVGAT